MSPARAAIIFSDDFESGLSAQWSVGDANGTGTPAYWAVVNSSFGGEGTQSGTNKIYCAGFGYAGNTSSPTYRDSMTAFLQRSINLSSYTNATLNFWHKIPGIETGYDVARIFIDGTEIWTRDTTVSAWTQVTLNINAFVGGTRTLKFEFLSDSSVTGEGCYLDDISVTDIYTAPPPPPPPFNDNFNSAQVLSNADGSVGGNNFNSTSEPGEPVAGNSVWYRWTPTTNGLVSFSTTNSSFDTVLCIYTGSNVSNLTVVACDDNSGANNTSLISFNAISGTTYRISIRGLGQASGEILLSWNQPNGAGVEILPDLFVWADQSKNYLYGWYLDQTEISGRTLLRISTATPNIGAGPLEVRGSSTQPGVYQRVFYSGGGYYDRYAGTFTFHAGHGHLHFDNWLNFHLRSVLTNDGVGNIVVSGDKTSFAIIDLTRYSTTLPGSPSSGQYSGGLVQGLSVGWADVYGANLQDQWIDVTDVAPGRYWLEAIVDPQNNLKESNENNNTNRILIDLTVPPPISTNAPPNDHFTNAIVIIGSTAGFFGYNVNATEQPGEPNHFGTNGIRSVWYQWTAPSNMPVKISTDGSSFDTILAVYTGAALNSLTLVTNDDDGGAGNNSLLNFNAVAGTTYRIAVDGFGTANGSIQLNFNPAFNDHFTNCVVLVGNSGSVSGSNRGATRQSGEPNHAGIPGTNSVWYCWTAPQSGTAVFDTFGSGFDTLLAIYTGSGVDSLSLVASNDNTVSNSFSSVTFEAIGGVTYQIAVDGANGGSGILKLKWLGPTSPSIVVQPFSTNAPAGATVSFIVSAAGSAPLNYQWLFQDTNLSNDEYISGANGATLTLAKIRTNNMGSYTVVISNNYGSITSAPANLIVLDNPRVVFVHDLQGHIGGVVRVPIEMQATGNEHALKFSLAFDPAILSNPRITNSEVGAAVSVNTNQVASGKFGVTLTLATNQTVAAGERHWALALFDASSGVPDGTMTPIGFVDQPTAKTVSATNNSALVTLFVAGEMTLRAVDAIQIGTKLPDGRYQVWLSGIAGRNYAIQSSDDLIGWTPFSTNQMNLDGMFQFIDNQSTNLPRRFYRAALLP